METFGALVIPQLNSAGNMDMAKHIVPHAAIQMGQTARCQKQALDANGTFISTVTVEQWSPSFGMSHSSIYGYT